MDLENLGKKLVKEFKRSPAKSALLVLMIPVAIYCIAPLVIKAMPKTPPPLIPPTPNGMTATNIPSNNLMAPLATQNAKPDAPSWETLEKWRDVDHLAKAVAFDGNDRNPFEFVVTEKPPEPVVELPPPEPVVETRPVLDVNKLPLELQATLVGGRVRRATINGHTVREGQRLRLDGTPLDAKEKLEAGTYLVVEEIHATSVTLTFGQQTIDLMIKSLNPLGAGQIVTRREAN